MSSQVQRLIEGMASLEVKPKRKRRKKNKRVVVLAAPAGPNNRRKRRRKAPKQSANSAAELRLRRTDYLCDVKGDGTAEVFKSALNVMAFGWLQRVAAVYSKSVWHTCKLIYRPSVGATVDGEVAIGVDFDSLTPATTRPHVYALSPTLSTPVWMGKVVSLPPQQLQSRREYLHHSSTDSEKGPGIVYIALPKVAKTYGTLWVEYDVTLRGTQIASGNLLGPPSVPLSTLDSYCLE